MTTPTRTETLTEIVEDRIAGNEALKIDAVMANLERAALHCIALRDDTRFVPTSPLELLVLIRANVSLRSQVAELEAARTVAGAIDVLRHALETDPGYRYGWQANIAMFCYDALRRRGINRELAHAACDEGAVEFLRALCMVSDKGESKEGGGK